MGCRALADSPRIAGIVSLDFTDNAIGDYGLAAIAYSDRLPKLRRLHVRQNWIGDDGALALAHSPMMGEFCIWISPEIE